MKNPQWSANIDKLSHLTPVPWEQISCSFLKNILIIKKIMDMIEEWMKIQSPSVNFKLSEF